MVSLNYRTSTAHHDGFSACTWLGGAIQAVPHWCACTSHNSWQGMGCGVCAMVLRTPFT